MVDNFYFIKGDEEFFKGGVVIWTYLKLMF